MKKLLLLLAISFAALVNAQTSVTRYLTVSHNDDTLRVLDTSSFNVVRSVKMIASPFIASANGMTLNPKTGIYYLIVKDGTNFYRELASLNPKTGALTIIGKLTYSFAALFCTPGGKLYGEVGRMTPRAHALFRLNTSNADTTFVKYLSTGTNPIIDGVALAFCTANGKLYRHVGEKSNPLALDDRRFEKRDTISFNSTLVTRSGALLPNKVESMTYISGGKFIIIDNYNRVFRADTSGKMTLLDSTANQVKGIAMITCPRTITGTASFCAGSSTTLTAAANAISYKWYKNHVAIGGQTAQTLVVTTAGKYNCIISDACGADSLTTPISVVQNAKPVVTLSGTPGFCSGTAGTLLTGTSGGTSQWYRNKILIVGATSNTYTAPTAGKYNMIKTNTNGCSDSAAASITVVVYPLPTATISSTNVLCNGGNTGTATVVASGGTGGYTYNWSPSGGNAAATSALTAGGYTCTISDANSCSVNKTATVSEPSVITATISSNNVLCDGGSTGTALVVASGGTGGYTYSWSPSGGNAASASGLAAGGYTCKITDANFCFITKTTTINQPFPLIVSVLSNNAYCNGEASGSATAVASGGTAPYNFSWTTLGTTNQSTSGLTAGMYPCQVTDANSCVTTESAFISEPSSIAISNVTTPDNCGGSTGTITIIATGGTGNLEYSIDGGSTYSNTNVFGALSSANPVHCRTIVSEFVT